MVRIAPQPARFLVAREGGRLGVTIPVKTNWILVLFLTFWLCGWAVGEVMVPSSLFQGDGSVPAGVVIFVLAWLGLWTAAGGFVIYLWCWNIAGQEVVGVSDGFLVVRREIVGLGRSREFDLGHVRKLRVLAQAYHPWLWWWAWAFTGVGGGTVAFDYGARTYRFGSGLDEAEARLLLDVFRPYLPADVIAPSV